MAGHGSPVCWTSLPGFASPVSLPGRDSFLPAPKLAEGYLPSQAERGPPAPRASAGQGGGRTVSRAWGSGLGARAWDPWAAPAPWRGGSQLPEAVPSHGEA